MSQAGEATIGCGKRLECTLHLAQNGRSEICSKSNSMNVMGILQAIGALVIEKRDALPQVL
jgi:hypothetical protein